MKKYTTFITIDKGTQKKISVFLDNKTATVLEEANDPQITHFYILEKHKEDLIQRKKQEDILHWSTYSIKDILLKIRIAICHSME